MDSVNSRSVYCSMSFGENMDITERHSDHAGTVENDDDGVSRRNDV